MRGQWLLSGKLRRSIATLDERRLWAGSDKRHEGRVADILPKREISCCKQRKLEFRRSSKPILDLSRFRAAPRARLSHLSFEGDRAFPAQC